METKRKNSRVFSLEFALSWNYRDNEICLIKKTSLSEGMQIIIGKRTFRRVSIAEFYDRACNWVFKVYIYNTRVHKSIPPSVNGQIKFDVFLRFRRCGDTCNREISTHIFSHLALFLGDGTSAGHFLWSFNSSLKLLFMGYGMDETWKARWMQNDEGKWASTKAWAFWNLYIIFILLLYIFLYYYF